MQGETITAVFDSPADADAAIAELRRAQVPEGAIRRLGVSDGVGFVQDGAVWDGVFKDMTDAAVRDTYEAAADPGVSVVSVSNVPARDGLAVAALLRRHRPARVDRQANNEGS